MKRLLTGISLCQRHLLVFMLLICSATMSFADTYWSYDDQGIRYEWNKENRTAIVAGYGTLKSTDIVISKTVWLADGMYQDDKQKFTVTGFKPGVFKNFTQLTSIKIEEGFTSLDEGMFEGCSNLRSVQLPSTITQIPKKTFYNCTSLESFTIPSTQTTVEDETFYGCSNLQHITIPEGITSIGVSAFAYCDNMKSVYLPSTLTSIGSLAFTSCIKLAIIINNSTTPQTTDETYEGKTFTHVETSNITLSVKADLIETYKASSYAWSGMNVISQNNFVKDGLHYNILQGNNVEVTYVGSGNDNYTGDIVIPANVELAGGNFNVVAIGNNAFRGSSVTSVSVPSSVKSIGEYAFYSAGSLSSVNIPNGVSTLSDNVFGGCGVLPEITIPASVSSIGAYAFYQCYKLKTIHCKRNTPPTVDATTFYGFKSLKSVTLYVPEDNYSAYSSDDIWNRFFIIPSVVKVGAVYYKLNTDYTAVVNQCPDGETYSGDIVIPETITVEGRTFNVRSIGESAFSSAKLTSLVLPNTIETIGMSAFSYTQLPVLNLPASLKEIHSWTFMNPQIEEVNIYSSEMKFNYGIVGLLSNNYVKTIKNFSKTPQVVANSDLGLDFSGITLYVYDSSVSAYQSAYVWKDMTIVGFGDHLNDQDKYTTSIDIKHLDITYTRNFGNTEWQALYVPFDMSYDDWANDFEVAKIDDVTQVSVNNGSALSVNISKVTSGTIEHSKPYFIKAKTTGEKVLTVSDATLYHAESNTLEYIVGGTKLSFTGTYKGATGAEMVARSYYAMSGGQLAGTNDTNASLNPFRWYLRKESTTSSAKELDIYISEDGGEPTLIHNAESMMQNDAPAYNLNGQRVNPNTKGIIIKNGHKVIIK